MKDVKFKILSYIWSKQKGFNSNFVDFDNIDQKGRQQMTKEYVLHLMSESQDLLNEINWKMHHKSDEIKINRRDLVLEWIDVFKYWLSIGLLWDITPEEFFSAFNEKSDLVEQRFLQDFSSNDGRSVVICDIDGVLSDYPLTFLNYVAECEEYHGNKDIRQKIFSKPVDNLDLYSFLENIVPTDSLMEYKRLYRTSGAIRKESVMDGAKTFLHKLKESGYYVILLTSRPFHKYNNLYLDTHMWLKSNGLEFDMLLHDSKKRDKITKILSDSTVKFVVDDDPKIVEGLLGIDRLDKIYLIDRPYNKTFTDSSNSKVKRVTYFDQILKEEKVGEYS